MSRKLLLFFMSVALSFSYVRANSAWSDSITPPQKTAQQLPANAVTLSPNPTVDKRFTITLKNLQGETQVEIYNILGKSIKKIRMTSERVMVDLNEFPAGIYLARVTNSRRNLVKKIVVK